MNNLNGLTEPDKRNETKQFLKESTGMKKKTDWKMKKSKKKPQFDIKNINKI